MLAYTLTQDNAANAVVEMQSYSTIPGTAPSHWDPKAGLEDGVERIWRFCETKSPHLNAETRRRIACMGGVIATKYDQGK